MCAYFVLAQKECIDIHTDYLLKQYEILKAVCNNCWDVRETMQKITYVLAMQEPSEHSEHYWLRINILV